MYINNLITGTMTLGSGGSTPTPTPAPIPTKGKRAGQDFEDIEVPGGILDQESVSDLNDYVEIVIGNDVTEIGNAAFKNNSTLRSITISETVTSIQSEAFENCELSSITIPASVINLGESAFDYCNITITMMGKTQEDAEDMIQMAIMDETNITVIGGLGLAHTRYKTYDGSFWNIVNSQNGILTHEDIYEEEIDNVFDIEFGNDVSVIGDSLLNGNSSISSLNIPNSVTTIGQSAFANCENLQSVVIGSGITTIGANAFGDCQNLTNMTIQKSTSYVESLNPTSWTSGGNLYSIVCTDGEFIIPSEEEEDDGD